MRETQPVGRRFWLAIVCLLVPLAIVKAFDLLTFLTEQGRALAKSQGWYEGRRRTKRCSSPPLLLVGLTACLACGWLIRHEARRLGPGLLGICGLVIFVMVRALSLHDVDWLLGRRAGPLTVNQIVELTLLGWISVCAAIESRR